MEESTVMWKEFILLLAYSLLVGVVTAMLGITWWVCGIITFVTVFTYLHVPKLHEPVRNLIRGG